MEEILNTQRVAEILSISPRKVGELKTAGQLKGYERGRNTYYLLSDLIRYIKGRTNTPNNPQNNKQMEEYKQHKRFKVSFEL